VFLYPTASDSVARELLHGALMTQVLVTIWVHSEHDFMKQEHL